MHFGNKEDYIKPLKKNKDNTNKIKSSTKQINIVKHYFKITFLKNKVVIAG